ncbi:hypothetical protein [Priestia koreensis]|uniref:hypothetical protein n=1 Tax=Priestia koreensis TaxID=284581 RepID=UPI000AF20B90|nr:hypothetical protein [Priestia koreensis]
MGAVKGFFAGIGIFIVGLLFLFVVGGSSQLAVIFAILYLASVVMFCTCLILYRLKPD